MHMHEHTNTEAESFVLFHQTDWTWHTNILTHIYRATLHIRKHIPTQLMMVKCQPQQTMFFSFITVTYVCEISVFMRPCVCVCLCVSICGILLHSHSEWNPVQPLSRCEHLWHVRALPISVCRSDHMGLYVWPLQSFFWKEEKKHVISSCCNSR